MFRFERRDFLAIVIGDGNASAAVRALARTLEVEPYVWFNDWQHAAKLCVLLR